MHWADVIAEKLLEESKDHIIESGTSISGQPHIGSAEDIILAETVCRAINDKGGNAKLLWVMDDLDGLRKVPKQLPESFKEHIGKPAAALPCPTGCCSSFVEHFTKPFIEALARAGVRPEVLSVAEMYQEGKYLPLVKQVLSNADEVRAILKSVSGSKKEGDWHAFFPICENCGKILTTHAHGYTDEGVKYTCKGGIAGKNFIEGCGHEGVASLKDGKMPWKLDWPARWKLLDISCEPIGKDLAAAGGSYDTSSEISEKLFDKKRPYPIRYEWILFSGQRVSKSAGHIITLDEVLSVATPEVTRYFFLRSNPTTHKDFDISKNLLQLADAYEMAERLYFGIEETFTDKEAEDVKRTYEFSQIDGIPEEYFQVPYKHLVSIVQMAQEFDDVVKILKRTGEIGDMTQQQEAKLKLKITAVRNWVDGYAPEFVKFAVQKEMPNVELSDDEKKILAEVSAVFSDSDWSAGDIHNKVYKVIEKLELKPPKVFAPIYKVILGRKRGPRLGYFLSTLEKEFVEGRLKEATH